MNKITSSLAVLITGALLLAGSVVVAQTTTSASGAGAGVVDPGHPRVNQVNRRETRQQQRIANGEKSGTLTAGQASRLERRESNLQSREQKDMAAHNGHLTKAEQRGLNRQENRISRSTYREKHK